MPKKRTAIAATKKRSLSAKPSAAPCEPKERPPESKRLYLTRAADETNKQALARYAVLPEVNAASTIVALNASAYTGEELDLTTLMHELQGQSEAVNNGTLTRGESMLAAQAQTLDAMFHFLTRKALTQQQLPQYDTFMRLALKAQSQCRTTWEAVSEIKNPRSVAFVKQANIANNQQINHGSGAREIESPPSKLLGNGHALLPNAGASTQTGRGNQALETVGAINGTTQ